MYTSYLSNINPSIPAGDLSVGEKFLLQDIVWRVTKTYWIDSSGNRHEDRVTCMFEDEERAQWPNDGNWLPKDFLIIRLKLYDPINYG
jgi:hypothetical protein